MKTATRLLLAACLAAPLLLAACKKEEKAVAETAPLAAPTSGETSAWNAYLNDVVPRNMGKVTNTPFVYFLPAQTDPDFQGKYDRQLESVKGAMARGVPGGNLIAFASPESAKMADIVETSFKDVPADTMKNVRILFIGQAADQERVQAVIVPTGADFVFIEAK